MHCTKQRWVCSSAYQALSCYLQLFICITIVVVPVVLHPSHIFLIFTRLNWGTPRRDMQSLSARGSPPSWTCPEYLHREVSRRHPQQIRFYPFMPEVPGPKGDLTQPFLPTTGYLGETLCVHVTLKGFPWTVPSEGYNKSHSKAWTHEAHLGTIQHSTMKPNALTSCKDRGKALARCQLGNGKTAWTLVAWTLSNYFFFQKNIKCLSAGKNPESFDSL